MVIGVLQVELFIGGSMSLKDKRSVVLGIKDRLGRDNAVAVAEVDKLDAHQVAVLGFVTVSNSAERARQTLDRIVETLRAHREAVLANHQVEIISGH
jgi:uncharacterized protein YlxP (DUF503 family)